MFLVDAPGAWRAARRWSLRRASCRWLVVRACAHAHRRVERSCRRRCATARGGRRTGRRASRKRRCRRRRIDRYAAALLQRALPLLGIAGIAAWIAFTPFRADAPPLRSTARGDAQRPKQRSRSAASCLAPNGDRMSVPRHAIDDPAQRQWHAFVWREAGRDAYRALVGSALAPPLWDVRFARFDGDVAERAEEWRVTVDRRRQGARRSRHRVAGGAQGRDAARATPRRRFAERALRERFGLDPAALILRARGRVRSGQRARDWSSRTPTRASTSARAARPGSASRSRATRSRSPADRCTCRKAGSAPSRERDDAAAGRAPRSHSAPSRSPPFAALVFAIVAWARGRCESTRARPHERVRLRHDGRRQHATRGRRRRSRCAPRSRWRASLLMSTLGGGGRRGLCGAAHRAHRGRRHALRGAAATDTPRRTAAGVGAAARWPHSRRRELPRCSARGAGIEPVWPEQKQAAAWLPWLASCDRGYSPSCPRPRDALPPAAFDRLTAGWTKRVALDGGDRGRGSAAAVVRSLRARTRAFARAGRRRGAVTFALRLWLLLRYDLRTVPGVRGAGHHARRRARTACSTARRQAGPACAIASLVVAVLAWRA